MRRREFSAGFSFAEAEAVDLDNAGRVLITDRLIELAGLQHDVVILGVQDHLELWDAAKWKQYSETHTPRFDAVAEAAFRPKGP